MNRILLISIFLTFMPQVRAKGSSFVYTNGQQFNGFGSLWKSKKFVAGLVGGGMVGGTMSALQYNEQGHKLVIRDPIKPLKMEDSQYWPNLHFYSLYWEKARGLNYNRSSERLVCSAEIPVGDRDLFRDVPPQEIGNGTDVRLVSIDPYLWLTPQQPVTGFVHEVPGLSEVECDLDPYVYCCEMDCCERWRPWHWALLAVLIAGAFVFGCSMALCPEFCKRRNRRHVPTPPPISYDVHDEKDTRPFEIDNLSGDPHNRDSPKAILHEKQSTPPLLS